MKVAVMGSGAWGTALAIRLCTNGHDVTLWFHNPENAKIVASTGENLRLPGVLLPKNLKISDNVNCVSQCDMVVLASPSYAFRQVCKAISPYLPETVLLVSATKGIETETKLRMSSVAEEETGKTVVALTGPSHAEEVARGIPTGLLAACPKKELAEAVQDAFMSDVLRVYTSPDIVGAELGGALKNVIALCAGVTDGLGYGDNIKAMLMTRGLTEMGRLGVRMGAYKDTFAGLAGVGDLIVTCTSKHSRNRQAGMLIGQGKTPEEAMAQVGAVVEGYYAAQAAWALCQEYKVEMPIVQAAYTVLHTGISADKVVEILLNRSKKAESEEVGWL